MHKRTEHKENVVLCQLSTHRGRDVTAGAVTAATVAAAFGLFRLFRMFRLFGLKQLIHKPEIFMVDQTLFFCIDTVLTDDFISQRGRNLFLAQLARRDHHTASFAVVQHVCVLRRFVRTAVGRECRNIGRQELVLLGTCMQINHNIHRNKYTLVSL